MINVNLVFIFIAAVAFLGFILNSLFDKIKITSILPLMLIGLIIGPILNMVDSSPGSVIADLSPYISAIAIAFILFDVGINLNPLNLKKVFAKASAFMLGVGVTTGVVLSIIAFFALHWTLLEAFMFGFALSGPSSIIVPTLMKVIRAPDELKTTLLFESVSSDTLELIIPVILLSIILTANITAADVVGLVVSAIFGSIIVGAASALFWLFVLGRYKNYSRAYSWMLTISMVLATYGISQIMGMSGLIAVFVFGILFTSIGSIRHISSITHEPTSWEKYFSMPEDVEHIRSYQKEITLFTSTFFFVYIGLLFSISNATVSALVLALMLSFIIMLVRLFFAPMLKPFMSNNSVDSAQQQKLVYYNIARGLSPSIVATLPIAAGIIIPGFLDEIFMVILFTNVLSTAGVFLAYKYAGRVA